MPTQNKAEWLHRCRQERAEWGDALAWAVEEAVATKLDITEDYILDAVGPETIVPALIKAIGEDRRVAAALARAHRWAVADHLFRKEQETNAAPPGALGGAAAR